MKRPSPLTAGAITLGSLTAIVALVFGADGWRVVGWALVVAALMLLRELPGRAEAFGARDDGPVTRGRPDLDRLAFSLLERGTRVRTAALRRVAAVAAAPLADAGLDPLRPDDRPAIDALLGAGATAVLLADDRVAVDLPTLDRVLSGLERRAADSGP